MNVTYSLLPGCEMIISRTRGLAMHKYHDVLDALMSSFPAIVYMVPTYMHHSMQYIYKIEALGQTWPMTHYIKGSKVKLYNQKRDLQYNTAIMFKLFLGPLVMWWACICIHIYIYISSL